MNPTLQEFVDACGDRCGFLVREHRFSHTATWVYQGEGVCVNYRRDGLAISFRYGIPEFMPDCAIRFSGPRGPSFSCGEIMLLEPFRDIGWESGGPAGAHWKIRESTPSPCS